MKGMKRALYLGLEPWRLLWAAVRDMRFWCAVAAALVAGFAVYVVTLYPG
jgi:hypothetical protein